MSHRTKNQHRSRHHCHTKKPASSGIKEFAPAIIVETPPLAAALALPVALVEAQTTDIAVTPL